MMALANTYGLLFIILLLGQGLIQVPRQLWETSFNDKELQRLYFNATQVHTVLTREQAITPSRHATPACGDESIDQLKNLHIYAKPLVWLKSSY